MNDTHIFLKRDRCKPTFNQLVIGCGQINVHFESMFKRMYRIEIKFLLKFIFNQKLNPHTAKDEIHIRLRVEFTFGNDLNSNA